MTTTLMLLEREKQLAEGSRQDTDEALQQQQSHANHKAVEEVVCPDQEAE